MKPASGAAAPCIAFEGDRRIASGNLRDVIAAAKLRGDRRQHAAILVFDGAGECVEFDCREPLDQVLARLPARAAGTTDDAAPLAPRGPGRPKLGVVAREVTLLPRHWEWLAQQRGGASVAIRELVDAARRSDPDKDRIRLAREAAYRFMSVMAGNRPHYEDAIRALFAGEPDRFEELIAAWPADVRDHVWVLAESAFRSRAAGRAG